MSEPYRILVTGGRMTPDQRARAQAAAPSAEFLYADRVEGVAAQLATFDVVGGSLTGEQLVAATRLRWVHSWVAGADFDLVPEMVASPVVLTSSAGNGAIPLAEQAILLMLMLDRNVPRWMAAQREHRWDRFTHGELNGRTVGIVGLGNSGADLAEKCRAFHMRVLGVRRHADRSVAGVERIWPPERLLEMLPECDFVVVAAPITPGTRGLLGEAAFRAMKASAFYVCFSRGGVADDAALHRALREGWIAGAGLDAHGTEPLPADSPFWDLPNVIVTPHNGATTAGTLERAGEIFIDNLRRFEAGEPLRNVVDKAAGY
jgi:phosphoglycerate dehydrogenase-like enzyme